MISGRHASVLVRHVNIFLIKSNTPKHILLTKLPHKSVILLNNISLHLIRVFVYECGDHKSIYQYLE